MIELNTDDLKAMITSPDTESRRLGLTLVFENINDMPPTEVKAFSSAYEDIINIRTFITGGLSMWHDDGYDKKHHLDYFKASDDLDFIKGNVCDDLETLDQIFPKFLFNRLIFKK